MTTKDDKWGVTHCIYCERPYATHDENEEYYRLVRDKSLTKEEVRGYYERFCWSGCDRYLKRANERILTLLIERDRLQTEIEAWRTKPWAEQLREQSEELVKQRSIIAELEDQLKHCDDGLDLLR